MLTIFFSAHQLVLLDVLPKEANFINSISSITCFRIWKNGKPEFSLSNGACNFWVHMDNLMCHNGSKIVSNFDKLHIARLHDCRTHPIRQTWARATFGSWGCWKESWRIESFIRIMKLKRRLRWPGMTSHLMKSRASFIIGWTDLDRLLRKGKGTLLNKDGSVYLCLLSDRIGGGAVTGTLFTPCIVAKNILFLLRLNYVWKRYLRKEKTIRAISYRDKIYQQRFTSHVLGAHYCKTILLHDWNLNARLSMVYQK
jgi:hypothetical protein